MRNIVKALIVGVVLAEVAFAAYLLSPKGDGPTNEPDSAANRSATQVPADFQSSGTHVTAGNVAGGPSPGASTDATVRAPAQTAEGRIATEPAPLTAQAPQAPPQKAQSHPKPVHTPAPVQAQVAIHSKPAAVPQAARGHDGSYRHDSKQVSTAMTDQLVKESAKLDPSLPPPDPSMLSTHGGQSRRGSNPVAAAMTDQLVRQSAKLDPSLPPPHSSGTK
ncbi:hypothetical protein [Paraburkholderia fungorum]|uniref:hypothetical protein n=1 Tax=Paraburkholderia fungorum TaxID=134537 RepID=UPI0038BD347B